MQLCTITSIATTVGANRIVPANGIPYPLGDPSLPPAKERQLRRALVEKALEALCARVEGQEIFTT